MLALLIMVSAVVLDADPQHGVSEIRQDRVSVGAAQLEVGSEASVPVVLQYQAQPRLGLGADAPPRSFQGSLHSTPSPGPHELAQVALEQLQTAQRRRKPQSTAADWWLTAWSGMASRCARASWISSARASGRAEAADGLRDRQIPEATRS
ncbi:hypothetical protein AB0271_03350 [Kocuria palustris]|uniref:hypothetical protein n=1 Tax=Kocuria palustris TaxID=71999 RepID=UPI003450B9DA